jgi:hypothetical protein
VYTYRSGSLFGHVTDSKNLPLQDVDVTATGAFASSAKTDANGDYKIVVGLGDNTVCVGDYYIGGVQLTTPACKPAPTITEAGAYGPVDFTYGNFSSTPGSQLKITVEDAQTFAPLANATVLVQIGDLQVTKLTDIHGRIRISADPGTYVAYSYLNGYTPVTQSVTAGVEANENIVLLKNNQFVVGEVTVTRLTLDQILAQGIDVTDPANQQIYQFTATIVLNAPDAPPPLVTYWNSDGVPVSGSGFAVGGARSRTS